MNSLDTSFEQTGARPKFSLRVSEELRFWCDVLGISEQQLSCALSNAGEDADETREDNRASRTTA